MLFRIKEIRLDLGLTQSQMANLLNVTRSAYSLWEIEKNIIPLVKLCEFSNTFKISLDYITKLSNDNQFNDNVFLNKKELGKKIKVIRKQKNLTQEKLAKLLNTTHFAISAYENGVTLIPTIFLLEICKITNKSMNWCFNNAKEIKVAI